MFKDNFCYKANTKYLPNSLKENEDMYKTDKISIYVI